MDLSSVLSAVTEPECLICHDARFLRTTADPADPAFGRVVPCECADAEDEVTRANRLRRYSRIGPLANSTFATLDDTGPYTADTLYQTRYRSAVTIARRFAAQPDGWLVVSGRARSGKTHLAAAIVNDALARGTPAIYIRAMGLLDDLRGAFDRGDAGDETLLARVDRYAAAPLLVIDDLSMVGRSDWGNARLRDVLARRGDARLPTVIVAPENPADIALPDIDALLNDTSLTQRSALTEPNRYTAFGGMDRAILLLHDFTGFDTGWPVDGQHRATLQGALDLVGMWADEPEDMLVLTGGYGTGKTHLAASAAARRLAAGDTVAFAAAPDLLEEIRQGFDTPGAIRDLMHLMRHADLLVLDDYGAENDTQWAKERLYMIINYRMVARAPMVITSNQWYPDWDPRIRSRALDTYHTLNVVLRDVPDYRWQSGSRA